MRSAAGRIDVGLKQARKHVCTILVRPGFVLGDRFFCAEMPIRPDLSCIDVVERPVIAIWRSFHCTNDQRVLECADHFVPQGLPIGWLLMYK